MFQMTPLLISKRSWDRLADGDRKVLTEAAVEATAYQRQLSEQADASLVADLKAKGIAITEVDKSGFEQATRKVRDKWIAGPIGAYVKKVVSAVDAP